ncbi:hypothetical protein Sjap_019630 [Stephania japonica]|uniref:pectinesterase n=1 Tax=Stephania japonica TaxID=461633 RepID=A0AAP0HZJ1_9MAGN
MMKKVMFLIFLIFSSLLANIGAAPPTNGGDDLYDDLKVPSSAFLSSLRTAIDEVGRVTSIISKFIDVFGDFRLSNAVNDCMDLLDFSSDELSMTASATQNHAAKDNSTGNRRSDLRTWLSAALGNQDTCMDGFEGTNSFIKNIVGGGIVQVTSLVGELLQMVNQVPSPQFQTNYRKQYSPSWMKPRDRRLLQTPISTSWADAVVALDGSGNYTSVGNAVKSVPDLSTKRFVIYVKRGVYKENVEIKKKKWNIMLVGDGMNSTIITGNRNFVDGWTTFRSATFAVAGQGFIARDITFENTAGPEKHQAVALRCDSDLSAFYRCGIHGYQDTLYAHSLRQFYRECVITGTVDFIFGNGAVVIQNCQIIARKPLPQQKNSITAQGRKDPNQNTGFSIQFCNITGDSDLLASPNSTATYLGRPWKEYSKTVIMQSYMSNVIRSEGWLEWQGNFALDTLFYGEYMNFGPGASLSNRVKWPGFHALNNSNQATNFTVSQFIDGNLWLPSTGVRFTADLQPPIPMDSINALKGYNKVSEPNLDTTNNPSLRKARTRLIISISTLVLLTTLIIIASIAYASLSDKSEDTKENPTSSSTSSSDETLRSLCKATQHPNTCLSTLSNNSHTSSDPVELFKLSLKVSLDGLLNVSSVPKRMMPKANGKGVESALRDCEGLIGDAIDGVNKSVECFVGVVGEEGLSEVKVSDVRTWLSAALTDQETCLDGLEEVGSGGVGDEMRVAMNESVEFVSNSLAIVAKIVEMGRSVSVPPHRKLLRISVKL